MILYEHVSATGRAEISSWRLRLQNAQRNQLDQFLDRLEATDEPTLAQKMMAGPIVQDIYKLQIGGRVRLRPMACFGPADPNDEITLLCPATERDGKLEPASAPATAQLNRKEIINDPARRRRLERPEETRWDKKDKRRKGGE